MKNNKVRSYTDSELLHHIVDVDGFKGIPNDYWILGVQSNEDTFNEFDDKFYLFHGTEFVMVAEGTTNAGTTGLMNYNKYNKYGCAVIKTDEWYYGLWKFGKHRGRMEALRQVRPIKFFRDWNKNKSIDEIGKVRSGLIGINFHTVIYGKKAGFIRRLIGGWSVGCQVINNVSRYYKMLSYLKTQPSVTYCLIKEF